MNKIKKILISSFLLASCIILGRLLSIRTPIITISFSFIPLMLSAIILGYKYSTLIGALSDLIGVFLFPTGAYFPGFTLSSLLAGFIYGIFLYSKDLFVVDKKYIIKLIISVILVTTLINGLLNTIWVIITTNNAAKIIVPIRIIKQLLMAPIQVVTMILLSKALTTKINDYKEARE